MHDEKPVSHFQHYFRGCLASFGDLDWDERDTTFCETAAEIVEEMVDGYNILSDMNHPMKDVSESVRDAIKSEAAERCVTEENRDTFEKWLLADMEKAAAAAKPIWKPSRTG